MAAEPVPAASGSDGHKSFGERVTRLEDPALITGRGRFADDIRLPGAAHAAFVRSPHAHALIRSIESSAARSIDGVVAIYTLDDFRPCLAMERMAVGLPSPSYRQERDRPVLADGEVVLVGEPVAIVVAESRYIAEDAAALVDVDYDLLPAIADCRESLKPGADLVHRDADLFFGRVRIVAQEFEQRRQHSRCTESALEPMIVPEGFLQRMQFVFRRRDAFDGRDLVAVGLNRQHQAGPSALPVEQDRAGAADPVFAPEMRTGQAELLAHKISQREPDLDLFGIGLAVDGNRYFSCFRHRTLLTQRRLPGHMP
jgi:hypothetical protein